MYFINEMFYWQDILLGRLFFSRSVLTILQLVAKRKEGDPPRWVVLLEGSKDSPLYMCRVIPRAISAEKSAKHSN